MNEFYFLNDPLYDADEQMKSEPDFVDSLYPPLGPLMENEPLNFLGNPIPDIPQGFEPDSVKEFSSTEYTALHKDLSKFCMTDPFVLSQNACQLNLGLPEMNLRKSHPESFVLPQPTTFKSNCQNPWPWSFAEDMAMDIPIPNIASEPLPLPVLPELMADPLEPLYLSSLNADVQDFQVPQNFVYPRHSVPPASLDMSQRCSQFYTEEHASQPLPRNFDTLGANKQFQSFYDPTFVNCTNLQFKPKQIEPIRSVVPQQSMAPFSPPNLNISLKGNVLQTVKFNPTQSKPVQIEENLLNEESNFILTEFINADKRKLNFPVNCVEDEVILNFIIESNDRERELAKHKKKKAKLAHAQDNSTNLNLSTGVNGISSASILNNLPTLGISNYLRHLSSSQLGPNYMTHANMSSPLINSGEASNDSNSQQPFVYVTNIKVPNLLNSNCNQPSNPGQAMDTLQDVNPFKDSGVLTFRDCLSIIQRLHTHIGDQQLPLKAALSSYLQHRIGMNKAAVFAEFERKVKEAVSYLTMKY